VSAAYILPQSRGIAYASSFGRQFEATRAVVAGAGNAFVALPRARPYTLGEADDT